MFREKDIFETEAQMHRFQVKASSELRKAIDEEEKEYDCEEQAEKLLKRLEGLEASHLETIKENQGDEELKEKTMSLIQEVETARKNLNQGNLYELRDYLEDIERIIENFNFSFPEGDSERTAHYFIGNALHGVNLAIEYRKAEGELEGHTEELIERIESADEEEVRRIKQRLESSNSEEGFEVDLEEKCERLWRDTEKVRKHIEKRNFKQAKKYVDEVGKLLEAIEIDLDHIEKLHEKYDVDFQNPFLKNVVYPIKNEESLLIKFQGSLRQCKKLKKFIDQIPENVNLARIKEVGLYSGEPIGKDKPGQIIERVSGYQVQHAKNPSKLLELIADAPQEHFNKLVKDSETMIKYGVVPDASDNLFYNKRRGFVWIDPLKYDILARIEKGMDKDRFNYFSQTVPKSYADTEKDKENARKVFNKLKKAEAPQRDKSLKESLEEFIEGHDRDLPDWTSD